MRNTYRSLLTGAALQHRVRFRRESSAIVEGNAGVTPTSTIEAKRSAAQTRQFARQLLAEAGYPEGRDIKTGKPLALYLDTPAGGPDSKARLNWLRKQFAKAGHPVTDS